MSRTKPRTPTLKSARRRLAAAFGALYQVMAQARGKGLVSDEEIYAFRRIAKPGAEFKVQRVADADRLLAVYAEWTEKMQARLKAHAEAERVPVEGPTAHTSEPTSSGAMQESPPASQARPSVARLHARPLTSLQESELEERATKLKIAVAMTNGCTAAQALTQVGLAVTSARKRWAQRVADRYAKSGVVDDQRVVRNGSTATVLTPEMRELIEVFWWKRRGTNATGIRLMIEDYMNDIQKDHLAGVDVSERPIAAELQAGQATVPSEESIRRVIASLGKTKQLAREQGWSEVRRQMRPLASIDWTSHAQQEWQIDHTPLDVWARAKDNGVWVKVVAYLTAVIDVHSRAIVAAVVSSRPPDSFTTAHALRMGILPKPAIDGQAEWHPRGIPSRLVMDNGKDFKASQVKAVCGAFKIDVHYCRNYNPDEKPHIERFFGRLTREFLSTLHGYKYGNDRSKPWSQTRIDGLLTVGQLRAEILRWIRNEYHLRRHETTHEPPQERWLNTAPEIVIPHVRELDALLLHTEERRVARGVIRLTLPGAQRGIYWGGSLTYRNGERLQIRYNPDDLLSVFAYTPENEFVGELWNLRDPRSPYTDVEVREAWHAMRRHEVGQQKELADRLRDYFAKTAEEDRLSRSALHAEMAELRREADALLTPPVKTAPSVDTELLEDMEAMRAILSGEEPLRPGSIEQEAESERDEWKDIDAMRRHLSA